VEIQRFVLLVRLLQVYLAVFFHALSGEEFFGFYATRISPILSVITLLAAKQQ
jgi:hypothetical protein